MSTEGSVARCSACREELRSPSIRCGRLTVAVCSSCGGVLEVGPDQGIRRTLTDEEERLYLPSDIRQEVKDLRAHLRAVERHGARI